MKAFFKYDLLVYVYMHVKIKLPSEIKVIITVYYRLNL